MKLKDTLYYDWYKKLFVLLVLFVLILGSYHLTDANFSEIFENTKQMKIFFARLLQPDFSYLPKIGGPLLKTLQMSIWGTTLGVLFAIPFAFLGTTFVTSNLILTTIIRFILGIVRTIPNLLLAALLVAILGIGEATGVLTIAIFTFGMVSQLLYEAIESIDLGPLEASEAVGATKIQISVFAILPQIMSQIASYTLYALEVNVRASTVLGYVGAGGIGVILNAQLALFRYDRVSIIILTIFIVVAIVDGISGFIRRRLL